MACSEQPPAHQQKPRNSLPLSPTIAAQQQLCRLQAETETRMFRFLILPTQARMLAPPPLRSRLERKPNPSCLRKKLRSLTLSDTSGERSPWIARSPLVSFRLRILSFLRKHEGFGLVSSLERNGGGASISALPVPSRVKSACRSKALVYENLLRTKFVPPEIVRL